MRLDLLLAAGLILAGCCLPSCRRADEPGSAPQTATIDGRTFRLTADLWRDFMPIAPPDGQPLMAVARVTADDGLPLPDDIEVDRLWVINNHKQWAPKLAERDEKLSVYAAEGPKWGPGIEVDVVARITRGKQSWLIRAAGVPITRTD